MKNKSNFLILFLVLTICLFPVKSVFAGFGGNAFVTIPETDNNEDAALFYFFDLRERETFIQLTYSDPFGAGLNPIAHVQIFDVGNNCNENDFFDNYTINDTHVYNMRDIQTNDGNPSGVVLPEGSYGIVAITLRFPTMLDEDIFAFGNLRIIDNNGYEYRTNAQHIFTFGFGPPPVPPELFYSFNFNQKGGVTLSDVVGLTIFFVGAENILEFEIVAQPVQGIFSPFDIDIVDLNETIFSCRDIIFSCVNEDNPLLEELLSIAGTASVASFEYGINNAIPHSKGGELLCPGNNISDGAVILTPEAYPDNEELNNINDQICTEGCSPPFFFGFVGLNNGNGRGSMDSFWTPNLFTLFPASG